MPARERNPKTRLLGLGLDHTDGHTRVTRGENFTLYLGSESTHERMQETCIKLNEKLKKNGQRLEDLSHHELAEMLAESQS